MPSRGWPTITSSPGIASACAAWRPSAGFAAAAGCDAEPRSPPPATAKYAAATSAPSAKSPTARCITSRSYRIVRALKDHRLADLARAAQRLGIAGFLARSDQLRQLLVEERRDLGSCVHSVLQTLRDHQAVDAVGCEIFHVAVEQTRALPIEVSVAVADH